MSKTSANDGDAPSIEDHLALQQQVEDLKVQLGKLSGSQGAPGKPAQPTGYDLEKYDQGEFEHKGSGKKFRLKYVPDDQHGRPFHFKNEESTFQASTPAEMDEHFIGTLPSSSRKFQRPGWKHRRAKCL